MLKYILTIAFLWSSMSYAQMFEMRQFSLEATKIVNKRHHFFPDYELKDQWRNGLNLKWNLEFVNGIVYWNNDTYFDTDYQVRHIGWKYEQGVNLWSRSVQVMYQHHSQHGAEYRNPNNQRYPLDDRYGFRLNFILK